MLRDELHESVLKSEVIKALSIKPDGVYIDATFGRGGHSESILSSLGPHGRLVAIDRDPEAVEAALKLQKSDARLSVVHTNFGRMGMIPETSQLLNSTDGILFDLGVSSPQLQDPNRGFSFMRDGPLDMRMNPTEGESVANWLKKASESEISDVIYEFGEERASRKIAKAIITVRNQTPIESTTQLVEIISKIKPSRKQDIHPATKTFQAFRIFINNELEEIRQVLPQVTDILCKGGRLAAISFHSLEDRIVKRFMLSQSKPEEHPIEIPIEEDQSSIKLKIIGKKIRPTNKEISENRRARSALLRIAERM